MFPLRDNNPTLATPIAIIGIILLNLLAWMVLQGVGTEPRLSQSVCEFGLIPGELLGRVVAGTRVQVTEDAYCVLGSSSWVTLLTSMFMHGGWFHLIGNMWFLWVFGNNIEDIMGRARFVVFYVLCGLAAAAVQMLTNTHSAIPMVGASGAIGGVMGAYAVTYPRARIDTLIFLGFFVRTIQVPALGMLGYWFVLQLIGGLPALAEESAGGVAFWAHVGGFLAGVVLVYAFRNPELLAAHRAASRVLERTAYAD